MVRHSHLSSGENYVVERFEEAINIGKRLPPMIVPGYICIWPEIARTEQEKCHYRDKKKFFAVQVTTFELKKLDEVQEWILNLSVQHRKILWMRAAKVSWQEIANFVGKTKSSAKKEWIFALNKVLEYLRVNNVLIETKPIYKKNNWDRLYGRERWLYK